MRVAQHRSSVMLGRYGIFSLLILDGCSVATHRMGEPDARSELRATVFVPSRAPASTYAPVVDTRAGRTPLTDAVLANLRTAGIEVPPWDPRLALAADDLAEASSGDEPLSYSIIEFALHHYGIVEPTPRLMVVSSNRSNDGDLAKTIAERLKGYLDARSYSRIGIGVRRHRKGQRVVVVALQNSYISLEPVPRRISARGKIHLRTRLAPPFRDPVVFVTHESGDVSRIKTRHDRRGIFSAEVSCHKAGRLRIELSADAPEGSTVLANFPVFCGIPIPRQMVLRTTGSANLDLEAGERHLLELINRDRAEAGLPQLTWDSEVASVARAYSQEMARTGKVVHVSTLSGSADDRLRAAGVIRPLVQENLARASTVVEAHDSLMNSPGHRANILSAQITHAGIGLASSGDAVADDLLVTELFVRVPPRIDPDAARRTLTEQVSTKRRLRVDADLARIAQKRSVRLARQGGGKVDAGADSGMLRAVAHRYRAVRALVVAVADVSQFNTDRIPNDPGITHFGLGVAQGNHPKLGKDAIYVIVLLGTKS